MLAFLSFLLLLLFLLLFLLLPSLLCHGQVCDSEWISPKQFKQTPLGKHIWSTKTSIPLYNSGGNPLAALLDAGSRIPTQSLFEEESGEKHATFVRNDGNVQKKISPWKILPPDDEITTEVRRQR